VPRTAAVDPLVLAVDVGSTATRGDVYDAAGRPVEDVTASRRRAMAAAAALGGLAERATTR
jgi:gluconokinase